MSAQEATFEQYHQLMQINAASHLIRAARELGIFKVLRGGQHTADQLCEELSLQPASTDLLLDGLVAIGIVERYEEDYALSRAGHLLCQYDEDLGDHRWQNLVSQVSGESKREEKDDQPQLDYLAATQWVHTPAAIQAAEILNVGGEDEPSGIKILDLGGGSAVWSCAMAHRDPQSTVTVVDTAPALEAARSTAESIGMLDRFEAIPCAPATKDQDRAFGDVEFADSEYDLVLIAQRFSCLSDGQAKDLLSRAASAAKPDGRVAVIDLFRGPTRPNLAECVEALKLDLSTRGGFIRTLEEVQEMLADAGLVKVQFAFLAASKVNLGMAVGVRDQG